MNEQVLLFDEHTRDGPAYKSWRLVRCTKCLRMIRWAVSSARGHRLRDARSPCCGVRMRPKSWGGFK